MHPRVGVGVFIMNEEGKFTVGKRKGSHGSGTWALPGGHLDFGESLEACAAREVLEETGLAISDVRFLTVSNDVMEEEGKHYVTIYMGCRIDGEEKEPQVLEPEKCEGWEWVSYEDVKSWSSNGERRLFSPWLNLLSQRPGFHPVESLRQ